MERTALTLTLNSILKVSALTVMGCLNEKCPSSSIILYSNNIEANKYLKIAALKVDGKDICSFV